VLTEFLKTGVYDRNRPFYTTLSLMDILISSNLERLVFDLSGQNDRETAMYQEKLRARAAMKWAGRSRKSLRKFLRGFCGDEETKETIRRFSKGKLPHRPPYGRRRQGSARLRPRDGGREKDDPCVHRKSL
jgi:threonine synthase